MTEIRLDADTRELFEQFRPLANLRAVKIDREFAFHYLISKGNGDDVGRIRVIKADSNGIAAREKLHYFFQRLDFSLFFSHVSFSCFYLAFRVRRWMHRVYYN
jgi:hypothetical protein